MNTLEQASHGAETEPVSSQNSSDLIDLTTPKISGFDGNSKNIFKEPSLYLSITIVLIASAACLSKSPAIFWVSFSALIAIAVMFHIVAERTLFKAKKEFEFFQAPFEGIFVVTFGAIIPGIGLLAYGIYALMSSQNLNAMEELGKLALLLVVPIFNFSVWSAIRRGYLVRPRLIGVMSGFALALSASWTTIWIKASFFGQSAATCKFGWMLLLCSSPFMLASAACMALELWQKTEPNIRKITMTFAVLGSMLSALFVFAPVVRSSFVQEQLSISRQGPSIQQASAISLLQLFATDEDLRPSKHPVSGFALAEMLVPHRGLETGLNTDPNLYFTLTGQPFTDENNKGETSSEVNQMTINPAVGYRVNGLALAKSQMTGNVDPSTLSSSLDWTLTMHNSTNSLQEARAEIIVPKHAAVSRATLWIDGHPREAAFASTAKAEAAYDAVVRQQKDPLLLTMPTQDHLLVQCFPIPANGGEMKIRIGFKIPLETVDGKECSMELPKMGATNFALLKRHRLNLVSQDGLTEETKGISCQRSEDNYSLSGFIKTNQGEKALTHLQFERKRATNEFATKVPSSKTSQYIIQKLTPVVTAKIKNIFVVVDSSSSLRDNAEEIKKAIAEFPARLKPLVYLVEKQDGATGKTAAPTAKPLMEAVNIINANWFAGGQDNLSTLQEALEAAAEKSDSAVVWIHGPQPISREAANASVLDLVHKVRLYDLQLKAGANSIPETLQMEDVSAQINRVELEHKQVVNDIKALVKSFDEGSKKLEIKRVATGNLPGTKLISDPLIASQIAGAWAQDHVTKLLAAGKESEAISFASQYRLVTPVTGAVVLDSAKAYKAAKLNPGSFVDAPSEGAPINTVQPKMIAPSAGLIGAPVDPRYGQSNEVGQLSDMGYDAARDVCRMLTVISFFISLFIGFVFLKGRATITHSAVTKAAALVIVLPTVVHLMGTFIINNFGGLGGGL